MIDAIETIKLILFLLGLIAFPVIFIVALIFILRGYTRGSQQRREAFQNFAQAARLTYTGSHPVYAITGAQYFRLFNLGNGHGRQITNSVDGLIDNFQVSIFDYIYYKTFGLQKMPKQTVVLISSPHLNLPLFCVQPRGKGLFQNLANNLSEQISFSDKTFSDKYLLIGQDSAHINQVFNRQIISYFKATDGFVIEGGGNHLLLYRDGMTIAPDYFQTFLQQGIKIAQLFAN